MVKESQPEWGRWVRQLRLERGWSQTKLAELAGTTQAHIANIEASRDDPKGDIRQRIHEAFGIKFVIKDANYDYVAGLEALCQEILDLVRNLTKKLGF